MLTSLSSVLSTFTFKSCLSPNTLHTSQIHVTVIRKYLIGAEEDVSVLKVVLPTVVGSGKTIPVLLLKNAKRTSIPS